MRTALSFLLIPSILLAISCVATAADSSAGNAAELRAADEQWSATAAKHDLAGTVAFYSDDAVLLPPNEPIAKDKKSIRESWVGLIGPNSSVSWKVTKAEVAKSGELGYVYGTYRLSMKDPKGGPTVNDIGKLVEIWKKQPDGKWKCAVDIFNSDLPAAPEAKK